MRNRILLIEDDRALASVIADSLAIEGFEVECIGEAPTALPGAKAFLDQLRLRHQVVILSDTFEEFAKPLMKQLGWPSIFCNHLETDAKGFIRNYHLRQKNGKEKAVKGLRRIGFCVHAAGDSYNDITMLKAADKAVLFSPPANIVREFPQFKVTKNYRELLKSL